MKLAKAIEILDKAIPEPDSVAALDMINAMGLGIEALKRIKKEREIQGSLYNYELPGETKEQKEAK